MFVTRAGRHDEAELKDFIEGLTGDEVDISKGSAMIAREGRIIGCVRVIEVEPNTLVYDHLLVEDGRDDAVSLRLVRAAMNNKGGRIYCAVPQREAALLEGLGFAAVEAADAPPASAPIGRGPGPPPGAGRLPPTSGPVRTFPPTIRRSAC